jgi:O-antigen/teichoic acid export membrane protein
MRKLAELIKSQKSKNIAINAAGNYLNILFIALLQPILFRILTPEEYAIFGILTTIAYLLTNILDMGTPATIYSYLPPLLEGKQRREVFQFIKSTFYFQTIFVSIVVIGLLLTFDLLDTYFFKTDASFIDFMLVSIMIIALVWQNFLSNIFFAAKKYLEANLALNISNLIRTIAIGILILTGGVSVTSMIFMIGIFGPLVFYLCLLYDKSVHIHEVLAAPVERSAFRFRYTLTYFVATQFLNVGLRADLFLLSFFRDLITKTEVGYYAAAQKIVLTLTTTIVSITQVLSPAFSQIKTQRDALREIKHAFLYLLIPCGLFAGLLITPDFVYAWFLGTKFLSSIPIVKAISLPFIICTLSSVPMLFLLYTIKRSQIILVAYFTFFIIMSIGCFLMIPVAGLFAPPIILAAGFSAVGIILSLCAYNDFKKLPER